MQAQLMQNWACLCKHKFVYILNSEPKFHTRIPRHKQQLEAPYNLRKVESCKSLFKVVSKTFFRSNGFYTYTNDLCISNCRLFPGITQFLSRIDFFFSDRSLFPMWALLRQYFYGEGISLLWGSVLVVIFHATSWSQK